MKCPNCKSEMEKGMLAGNGGAWIKAGASTALASFLTLGATLVHAYSCPKCGKVELTTKED